VVLTKMAQLLKSLPVQTGSVDDQMKQRQQQLKEAQFGFAQQREQNLVEDRDRKANMKYQDFMLNMARFEEEKKNNGVSRAGQLLDMMQVDAQEPALPASDSQPTK